MGTYTIIGYDGKQYHSVTENQLRQWIADSRVNAQTRALAEGTTEWKSLAEIPEFAALLPLPAAPTAPTAPQKTSGMAVTSLVLGILGLFTCGLSGLIGLILGIVAMVKVKNSGGRLGGFGLALAGTIVSAVFLFLIPFFAAMLLPALAAAKQKAQEITCINNEKQLALAVLIYSSDHTNHFPPAATWCDAIKTTAGSETVFKCPAATSSRRCDYAYNARLDGMDVKQSNPQTVMIFESDGGWNANGGPELMITHARHQNGRIYIVAFVDGEVEEVTQARLATLRWDP